MSPVEAVCLSGAPMLLEDCDTVGDVMTKIAIARERLATHIVVIDPTSGRQMLVDDIQISKVEFVILNEETAEMDIESCKLNLQLHAGQTDYVACSSLLAALEGLDPKNFEANAACALCDMRLFKMSKWSDAARTLLRLGVSGDSVLRHAAKAGHGDFVKFLVANETKNDNRIDVNSTEEDGATALFFASSAGHVEIVRMLLDAGADVNIPRFGWYTALVNCCRHDNAEMVRILLDAGAVAHRALSIASFSGNAGIVRILLDAAADVKSVRQRAVTAALRAASSRGRSEIVRILLDAEADVNGSNQEGDTPLTVSASRGHTETVRILLDAGAVAHSALYVAASCGNVKIVRLLLDAGTDANSTRQRAITAALRAASSRGRDAIVRILLDAGGNVHTRS